MSIEPAQLNVYGSIGTALAGIAVGFWQSLLATKAKKEAVMAKGDAAVNLADAAVSRQNELRAKSMEAAADDWRQRWEHTESAWSERLSTIQTELTKRSDYWHSKAEKDNEILLRVQEENSHLKATRDLAPILNEIKLCGEDRKEQQRINGELFQMLHKLTATLTRMENKMT